MFKKHKIGLVIISVIAICMSITLWLIKPIAQDISYHGFADDRTIIGIQNFWNVISNVPFLAVGLFAIFNLVKSKRNNLQLGVFFIGVTLVAFGSAYYHYTPNNTTLIWDRLPMTLAFMGLFSFVISDYINQILGKILLLPLLVFGIISIIYWAVYDDLSLYVFVQFFPILAIPVILIFFSKENSRNSAFWLLLVFYTAAKIAEHYDFQSYDFMKFISGHSLKHILASLGIYFFYTIYFKKTEHSQKGIV